MSVKGKNILLGVTASVAIYKSCELARLFVKAGASVKVAMSAHAAELIKPLLFETLTGNPVYIEMFPEKRKNVMAHISFADWADIFCVAPATANFIGKAASGVADDLVSTTFLTIDKPVIIAPAMNCRIWDNPAVQSNLSKLKDRGVKIIQPGTGELACGVEGKGRLANPQDIFNEVKKILSVEGPLSGKRILVTAGPTREYIDEVRFISNPSSGRMGIEIAKQSALMGGEVTLILGPTLLGPPDGILTRRVISAADMFLEVTKTIEECDILVMSSAVADWTTEKQFGKMKKSGMSEMNLQLHRTKDILSKITHNKKDLIVVGFAVETENLIENAKKKLKGKKLDMIFANNPLEQGAAFETETNKGFLITSNNVEEIQLLKKTDLARIIMNHVCRLV